MKAAHTPTALKWLAEKRARIAGELTQVECILPEVIARKDKLTADLAALDRTIQVYDPRLQPTDIPPVNAHSNYGKRGNLRMLILDVLKEFAPDWVGSDVVALRVFAAYPMIFASREEMKRWKRDSVGSALRHLTQDGLVEREQYPNTKAGQLRRWRIARQVQTPSLADLRALAKGADRNDEDTERPEVDGRETRPGGA
ncbi:MAG: hypothetical protein JOY60_10960 [Burkholderiaceae bacterium]|nr:hypothetical protein [Roseateles sp.]MBV8470362.1 hypothetical protein [Burkholderiaceae bacterium]